MKIELEFYSIEDSPLPVLSNVLVNVKTSIPEQDDVRFTTNATIDEYGHVVDQDGDDVWWGKDVTHWAYYPLGF